MSGIAYNDVGFRGFLMVESFMQQSSDNIFLKNIYINLLVIISDRILVLKTVIISDY